MNYFCNEIGVTLAVLPMLRRERRRPVTLGCCGDLVGAGLRAMRRPDGE